MIKIIFLGTNGWYDTDTGNTICVLIETPLEYVVLDAGNGLYKLDKYVKTLKPIHIFLSHFHLDHIEGLHVLAKFNFKQGINLYVPAGCEKLIKSFINRPFTAPLRQLPTNVKIARFPAWAEALPLRHVERCFGFRFEFEGKVICYCPDTGMCANAIKLARRADLLIAECAMKVGMGDKKWPHLNPETAAQIAKKAGCRKLVLVHFDAAVYQTIREREEAARKSRQVFKNTFAARDDYREVLK